MLFLNRIIFKYQFEIILISIWILYFFLIFISGYKSSYEHFSIAIALQCVFVIISIFTHLILSITIPIRRYNGAHNVSSKIYCYTIFAGISISFIAIISLYYSKSLHGIDYTKDICLARSQMTALGSHPTIFSVFGNLFSYSFFVSVATVLTQRIGRRTFWITIGFSVFCLLALSFVTSSRSTILLFAGFSTAQICLRIAIGNPLPKLRWADALGVALILGVLAIYGTSVFTCRAAASGMTTSEYQTSFVPFLGAKDRVSQSRDLAQDDSRDRPVTKKETSGSVGMAILYIVHSAYTLDGVLSLPPSGGHVLFAYGAELLSRVGLMQKPVPWVLSGRFVSLPGGLYYDLGLFGLIFGSVVLGGLSWAAITLARKWPVNILVIGGSSAFLSIMFLSPIHPAEEFMAFPFICLSFAAIWIIALALDSLPLMSKRQETSE